MYIVELLFCLFFKSFLLNKSHKNSKIYLLLKALNKCEGENHFVGILLLAFSLVQAALTQGFYSFRGQMNANKPF